MVERKAAKVVDAVTSALIEPFKKSAREKLVIQSRQVSTISYPVGVGMLSPGLQ